MHKCIECGGTEAEWSCFQANLGSASDGRLRMHDVHTIFVLSCTECYKDIRKMTGDDVAQQMTKEYNDLRRKKD